MSELRWMLEKERRGNCFVIYWQDSRWEKLQTLSHWDGFFLGQSRVEDWKILQPVERCKRIELVSGIINFDRAVEAFISSCLFLQFNC